jgi:outer membrane receptor protein involved in Fe transport
MTSTTSKSRAVRKGTLNGRNSTAGAVNLVSGAPSTSKVFGSASVTLGDYHHIQTQAMMNIPLSDDIALRIAAIKDQHDGYVNFLKGSNVQPGTRKYGAGDQEGARASLLWKFTPDLKATFIADYYSDTGAGNIYLSAEPKAGPGSALGADRHPGHAGSIDHHRQGQSAMASGRRHRGAVSGRLEPFEAQ